VVRGVVGAGGIGGTGRGSGRGAAPVVEGGGMVAVEVVEEPPA